MEQNDIVVIGAGISGASMAHCLAKMGRQVLVVEKEGRLGGAIQSCEYDDYFYELGAHTIYNSYTELLKMIEVAGVGDYVEERVKQKYLFVDKGKFSKLINKLNKWNVLCHIYNIFRTKKENFTVRDYYSKLFGENNYNGFVRHFFKAVLSQDPDKFPAYKVLKIRKYRNKSYPKSMTLAKGLQGIIDGFLDHPNIMVVKNTQVETILKVEDGYILETSKERIKTKDLVLASDIASASQICEAFAPSLSSLFAQIRSTQVASLGIVVEKSSCDIPLIAGLVSQSNEFNSFVSRDVFPHEKYRAFTIHSENIIDKNALREKFKEETKIDWDIVLHESYSVKKLPSLTLAHDRIMEQLKEELDRIDGLYIVGNYFEGLSIEDCLQRVEVEARRYINNS